jgi:hypothetical protein
MGLDDHISAEAARLLLELELPSKETRGRKISQPIILEGVVELDLTDLRTRPMTPHKEQVRAPKGKGSTRGHRNKNPK